MLEHEPWRRVEAPCRFPFDQSEFLGARRAEPRRIKERNVENAPRPTAVKAIGLTSAAGIGNGSATCPAGGKEGRGLVVRVKILHGMAHKNIVQKIP